MRVLVIDVGGTHVKMLATGHRRRFECPSGPKMTPAKMIAAVQADDVVPGGDTARLLKEVPSGTYVGDNSSAFQDGYRLWIKLDGGTTHKRFVH